MKIGAIILAAGGSTRFHAKQHKLLVKIDGKSVIRTTVEKTLQSDFQPVIVVVGAKGETITAEIHDLPIIIVQNTDWLQGQSTSLKCGLRAIPPAVESVCILLADQPLISQDTLHCLSLYQERFPDEIIAPLYHGKRGNPVFFPRKFFPDLFDRISGDSGGREIIREKGAHFVDVMDSFVLRDIDTIEDYQNFLTAENNE
ncbi:nucleotidyltransferase family protein [Flexilinea flocculi]|uniref:CTP:molybdopterin cytidylyltransferase MocA n=1 Tax=Flexilinea flocculi TaxID=1678840 RepID=A0A0S7BLH1_9CHLR|nr:nucleotidyltransferase family protein [Flexilinea flocculi]NMB94782.1 nucleotidyltransferase family protein [Flexilinea flocculi]GAP41164.1 CTP:molybdopterin cytidylyltransferase MocA [Flexilinea flocculi]